MNNKLKIISRETRVKDYLLPTAIKAVYGNIQNTETILIQKDLQVTLFEKDCLSARGIGYLILDFGAEIQGGIRIITHAVNGECKARLRFGESIGETCSEIIYEGATATNDHSLRDFKVQLVNLSDMQFGQTGFRFVRIDFLGEGIITIKSILGVFEHCDLKRIGSFKCSDERVNEIFETAAYTVDLCIQGMLWDGIKRDRLVWIGDLHPEMLSIISLYGKNECVEEALKLIQKFTPLPGFMHTIPAYSFWWLCIISDYFLHNNNIEFVKTELKYIKECVDYIDTFIDKDGKLCFDENDMMGFFLDWPTVSFPEKKAGIYALCSLTMQKLKTVYSAFGIDTSVLDGIIYRIDKTLDCGQLKQVTAMKMLAGHLSADEAINILLNNGENGLSTFMSYYIFSAIALAGKTKDAVEIMKKYYGAMLDRGATTFWEDFDIKWLDGSGRIDEFTPEGKKDLHGDYGAYCYKGFRHSLCHGWSGGPVPFLMNYVLGVKEIEPGCKTIEIKPNLCGLNWVKGTYPTPYGVVKIEHKIEKGKIKTYIFAPKKVKIVQNQ